MKYLIILSVLIFNITFADEFYQSYVQINPSTESGKIFVLVVLSPLVEKGEDDMAKAFFTLAIGDKKRKVFKDKSYSDRVYVFDVETWQSSSDKMGVTVGVDVLSNGISRYQSKQIIGAWQEF